MIANEWSQAKLKTRVFAGGFLSECYFALSFSAFRCSRTDDEQAYLQQYLQVCTHQEGASSSCVWEQYEFSSTHHKVRISREEYFRGRQHWNRAGRFEITGSITSFKGFSIEFQSTISNVTIEFHLLLACTRPNNWKVLFHHLPKENVEQKDSK